MNAVRFLLPIWTGVIIALFGLLHTNAGDAETVLNDSLMTETFPHHIWHEILSHHVSESGAVQFGALRAYPKRLNQYLQQLHQASPETHPQMFRDRTSQLAYWINAHNAIALRLILDRYPVTNLGQVPHVKTDDRYWIGGARYSLEDLESYIFEHFPDWPQAFFALSDLSRMSPRLYPQAYEGKDLKHQLKMQTQWVLNRQSYMAVLKNCEGIVLSAALKEFPHKLLISDDQMASSSFQNPALQDLVHWLKPYLKADLQGQLSSQCPGPETPITFDSPNLNLNRLPEALLFREQGERP